MASKEMLDWIMVQIHMMESLSSQPDINADYTKHLLAQMKEAVKKLKELLPEKFV